jgi:hypothetical protein
MLHLGGRLRIRVNCYYSSNYQPPALTRSGGHPAHYGASGSGWIASMRPAFNSCATSGGVKDASGRPYIETVLPWSKYIHKTVTEQRDIILDRVDLVFKTLLEKMAS